MSPGLLPPPKTLSGRASPQERQHRFLAAFQKPFTHVPAEKQITPLLLFETHFERFPLVTPSASCSFISCIHSISWRHHNYFPVSYRWTLGLFSVFC